MLSNSRHELLCRAQGHVKTWVTILKCRRVVTVAREVLPKGMQYITSTEKTTIVVTIHRPTPVTAAYSTR